MKKLSAAEPLKTDKITLIPIVETMIYGKSLLKTHFLYGSKRPKALIMIENGEAKAFDMNFEEIPVENFINKIEGLGGLIKIHI